MRIKTLALAAFRVHLYHTEWSSHFESFHWISSAKPLLSSKMTFTDGWRQDLDILWGVLSSLWQAAMWFCQAGVMNKRGVRKGSYGRPLSSTWQGGKGEQEEVRDGKMQGRFPEIAGFGTSGLVWWSRNWEVVVREDDWTRDDGGMRLTQNGSQHHHRSQGAGSI